MECQKVQELISGYLDQTLGSTELEQITVHLETCSQCRVEYENLKNAMLALSELEEVSPPSNFRPALMAKVAEERLPTSHLTPGSGGRKNKFFSWSRFRVVGAAAAVLVLAVALTVMANFSGIFSITSLKSIAVENVSDEAVMPMEPAAQPEMAKTQTMGEEAPELKAKVNDAGIAGMNSTAQSFAATGAAKVPAYQRKVIRNGRLELEVQSFAKAGQQVEFLTENAGGYIENMTTEVFEQNKKAGYYTLRIPTAQFGGILTKIKKLGRVKVETLGGTDVTQEYYDTEARSRNLQKQELRLLELLGQAKDLSDVLTLENELNRVRSEIETLEGRLHYLDNVVDLATLQVELREKGAPKTDQPWIFSGIFEKMGRQFAQSAGGILIFVAWVTPGLILLVITGGIIYFLVRKRR